MFGFFNRNRGFIVRTSLVLELHFVQNPVLWSPLRYTSSINSANQHSFCVSYLINSCGLSPESAVLASKRVHFKSPNKPDRVLSFLKNYGFSQTQISKLVQKRPQMLTSDPSKTFLPKLEFLQSKGLSNSDIIMILCSCPAILHRSLKNHIIPSFNFLKDLLHSDEKILGVIKHYHLALYEDLQANAEVKIRFLRDNGMSESNITKLFHYRPRLFATSLVKIRNVFEESRERGFDPSKPLFIEVFMALMSMSKSTWERKVDVLKRWGLSEEQIHITFGKFPMFMRASENKIMAVMDLFVNQLGWESSLFTKFPALLGYSLEKRLIPRASVLQFLVLKGLVQKDTRCFSIFSFPERKFLQKFVNCYSEAPELLKLYDEKLALSK